VHLNADAKVFNGVFASGEQATHSLEPGRHGWVHVARGVIEVNGHALKAGDGAALSNEASVSVKGLEGGGEVLVFDLG
jgi:hypothetical protein